MGKKLEKRSIPANILIYLILILLAMPLTTRSQIFFIFAMRICNTA